MSVRFELARLTIGRFVSQWRAAPPVDVVPDGRYFPLSVPADTVGMYCAGRVYVSANQPEESWGRVLAHEGIAHHGLRQVWGTHFRRLALAVGRSARKGGDAALRRLRGRVRRNYVDDSGRPTLRPSQEGDEVLAALAEEMFDPRSGRLLTHEPMQKQAEAMIGYIAREVLRADYPLCHRQAEGSLLLAEHSLRHGSLAWGAGYWARKGLQVALFAAAALAGWVLF